MHLNDHASLKICCLVLFWEDAKLTIKKSLYNINSLYEWYAWFLPSVHIIDLFSALVLFSDCNLLFLADIFTHPLLLEEG